MRLGKERNDFHIVGHVSVAAKFFGTTSRANKLIMRIRVSARHFDGDVEAFIVFVLSDDEHETAVDSRHCGVALHLGTAKRTERVVENRFVADHRFQVARSFVAGDDVSRSAADDESLDAVFQRRSEELFAVEIQGVRDSEQAHGLHSHNLHRAVEASDDYQVPALSNE